MTDTAFKHWINADVVATLAASLAGARATFAGAAFTHDATAGLEALELKDRVKHVATALRAHLAPAWPDAVAHLLEALPLPDTREKEQVAYWPFLQVVEAHGLGDPARSLDALREMTQVFTAEFALRPYVRHHPEVTFARLRGWTTHPHPRVRRLVSEGTRPRLPWGTQLTALVANPSPTLPLLEALRDDPSELVRRSVANHLNDIAKDHPDVVIGVARRWWPHSTVARQRLVRHALRTLIKAGNPDALAVLGYAPPQLEGAKVTVTPTALTIGQSVTVTVQLTSSGATPQPLVIDLAMVRPTQRGTSTKVFKGATRTLAPRQTLTAQKTLPIRQVSTRRWYPGDHRVEVLVNGVIVGSASFSLTT